MSDLSSYLQSATAKHWSIPHFNVGSLDMIKAIAEVAALSSAPVMIGTSEGERSALTPEAAVAVTRTLAKKYGIPLFLNADHTHSIVAAKAAIDAGYHSVHIDLSKLPFDENIKGTAEVVRYARRSGREISVEGELGALATDASTVYKKKIKIERASFTKPEEALEFVHKTGVNRLAPAVGNYHGISATKKILDFKLIAELRSKLRKNVALVLHGGSGSGDAAFRKAIAAGIANIHVSTELRVVFAKTLRETLKKNPDEIAPAKLLAPPNEAVKVKAIELIKLFGAAKKA